LCALFLMPLLSVILLYNNILGWLCLVIFALNMGNTGLRKDRDCLPFLKRGLPLFHRE
jgi:hypothetical protein